MMTAIKRRVGVIRDIYSRRHHECKYYIKYVLDN